MEMIYACSANVLQIQKKEEEKKAMSVLQMFCFPIAVIRTFSANVPAK